MDTGGRKWGSPYLTAAPSSTSWAPPWPTSVVLVMAEADGRPVGGALNLKGDDTLYGRYWGCLESHAFLHFEACYYQAHRLRRSRTAWQRVEAGAQGDHKIQRGYFAGADLLGALDRRSQLSPRRRRLSRSASGRRSNREIEALMKQSSPLPEGNESWV